jgi:SAM-dependent methyltransferase
MSDPTDPIAAQYERWAYPEPIADLSAYQGRQAFDPSLAHRLYWPDRDYPAGLDILVAGCGTNQAAEIAFHNRSARVLGIDVSAASLSHEYALKERHQLDNLTLRECTIESAEALNGAFDLIIASGVLHHLADPLAGLRALARCLKRDGVIAVMLYATHGRFAVNLLREFAQILGLSQDVRSVELMKATIKSLAPNHPTHAAYHSDPRQLQSDAMIVDLFLNARERSYSARECLELVEDAGLIFQRWVWNHQFDPAARFDPGSPMYRALAALDRPARWTAMECLTKPLDGKHGFVACRADRRRASWDVDFSSTACLDYVPIQAAGAVLATGQDGLTTVRREGASLALSSTPLALFSAANGTRSIRDIVGQVAAEGRVDIEQLAINLFGRLWACDIVHVRLPVDQQLGSGRDGGVKLLEP